MNVDDITVSVCEGKLRGKSCESYTGQRFYSFQGIPYAKPPLGKLRFKPPEPPEKWNGTRDATQEGARCYSRNTLNNALGGSEDCLFLNVYTPEVNKSKNPLAVMVWIHGGGFVRGSGNTDLYGPDYLIEKNIVLVTINYRIGPLGFLAFSDPSVGVTGNAGLKDMVMALKWVQRNIGQFSGNPKNVTIFGESAGGAAVEFLVLSPMAKGLFHKAIIQSGSVLNCFTRGRCSFTYELAHKLGIDHNDDKFILSELQKVPVEELLKASGKIIDPFTMSNHRPFCPVIEPKTKTPGFLTEEPLEILKSGRYNQVPMMMGYNTLEGVIVYVLMRNKEKHFLTDPTLVPHLMNLRIGGDQHRRVAEQIKGWYGIRGDESVLVDKDLKKGLRVYTHTHFVMDICRSALLHCQNNRKNPLYFYRFNLDSELNYVKKFSGIDLNGAAHADDLGYLFNTVLFSPPEIGSLEHQLIKKVTKLWTNFAKYGNPTPFRDDEIGVVWQPAGEGELNCLSLDNDSFEMLANPDKDFVDFWETLYKDNQVILSKL